MNNEINKSKQVVDQAMSGHESGAVVLQPSATDELDYALQRERDKNEDRGDDPDMYGDVWMTSGKYQEVLPGEQPTKQAEAVGEVAVDKTLPGLPKLFDESEPADNGPVLKLR